MEAESELPEDPMKREIIPTARYTSDEAAALLGFSKRPKSIYDIPERELRRTRVGARRGKVLYMGHDLLDYLHRGRGRKAS